MSAIMIAQSLGAGIIAIDIDDEKLAFTRTLGATHTINANACDDVPQAIRDLTDGGANVSVDALGHPETCFNSIACLRPRGRHVQIGLMLGGHNHSSVPLDRIIAKELEVYGSHGMQAHAYPDMLRMIEQGSLAPDKLVGELITLEESIPALMDMNSFTGIGIKVIDRM